MPEGERDAASSSTGAARMGPGLEDEKILDSVPPTVFVSVDETHSDGPREDGVLAGPELHDPIDSDAKLNRGQSAGGGQLVDLKDEHIPELKEEHLDLQEEEHLPEQMEERIAQPERDVEGPPGAQELPTEVLNPSNPLEMRPESERGPAPRWMRYLFDPEAVMKREQQLKSARERRNERRRRVREAALVDPSAAEELQRVTGHQRTHHKQSQRRNRTEYMRKWRERRKRLSEGAILDPSAAEEVQRVTEYQRMYHKQCQRRKRSEYMREWRAEGRKRLMEGALPDPGLAERLQRRRDRERDRKRAMREKRKREEQEQSSLTPEQVLECSEQQEKNQERTKERKLRLEEEAGQHDAVAAALKHSEQLLKERERYHRLKEEARHDPAAALRRAVLLQRKRDQERRRKQQRRAAAGLASVDETHRGEPSPAGLKSRAYRQRVKEAALSDPVAAMKREERLQRERERNRARRKRMREAAEKTGLSREDRASSGKC